MNFRIIINCLFMNSSQFFCKVAGVFLDAHTQSELTYFFTHYFAELRFLKGVNIVKRRQVDFGMFDAVSLLMICVFQLMIASFNRLLKIFY